MRFSLTVVETRQLILTALLAHRSECDSCARAAPKSRRTGTKECGGSGAAVIPPGFIGLERVDLLLNGKRVDDKKGRATLHSECVFSLSSVLTVRIRSRPRPAARMTSLEAKLAQLSALAQSATGRMTTSNVFNEGIAESTLAFNKRASPCVEKKNAGRCSRQSSVGCVGYVVYCVCGRTTLGR